MQKPIISKSCQQCGTSYKTDNPRRIYCSDGCKTEAYRTRKGISAPFFLKGTAKKPAEKTGLSGFVQQRTTNPEWVSAANELNRKVAEFNGVIANRQKKVEQLTALVKGGNPAVLGAILGGYLGYTIGEKKDKTMAGLLFGLAGAALGASQIDPQRTERQIQALRRDVSDFDTQSRNLSIQVAYLRQKLSVTPKNAVQPAASAEPLRVPLPKMLVPQLVPAGRNEETPAHFEPLGIFKQQKFDALQFNGRWGELVGNPQENFRMMIYGSPGQGKSTLAVELAAYLASNFGRVLYNSSEEGRSQSLQRKLSDVNSDMFDVGYAKTFEQLKATLANMEKKPRFVVIDSVNDMQLTISQLQELFAQDKKRGFIYIMQSTKGGDFKGGNVFAHESDVTLRVENYIPETEKNRFK